MPNRVTSLARRASNPKSFSNTERRNFSLHSFQIVLGDAEQFDDLLIRVA